MSDTPCARGGCTALVTGGGKYCTRRCGAIARLCAGWKPWTSILRPEVRRRACSNGGRACTAAMRKRRAKAVREQLGPLLNHRVFQDLDGEQKAAALALLGKAFRLGKAIGYQAGYRARPTPHLKRTRTAA